MPTLETVVVHGDGKEVVVTSEPRFSSPPPDGKRGGKKQQGKIVVTPPLHDKPPATRKKDERQPSIASFFSKGRPKAPNKSAAKRKMSQRPKECKPKAKKPPPNIKGMDMDELRDIVVGRIAPTDDLPVPELPSILPVPYCKDDDDDSDVSSTPKKLTKKKKKKGKEKKLAHQQKRELDAVKHKENDEERHELMGSTQPSKDTVVPESSKEGAGLHETVEEQIDDAEEPLKGTPSVDKAVHHDGDAMTDATHGAPCEELQSTPKDAQAKATVKEGNHEPAAGLAECNEAMEKQGERVGSAQSVVVLDGAEQDEKANLQINGDQNADENVAEAKHNDRGVPKQVATLFSDGESPAKPKDTACQDSIQKGGSCVDVDNGTEPEKPAKAADPSIQTSDIGGDDDNKEREKPTTAETRPGVTDDKGGDGAEKEANAEGTEGLQATQTESIGAASGTQSPETTSQQDTVDEEEEEPDEMSDLSEKRQSLVRKHRELRSRYEQRLARLAERFKSGLPEEQFDLSEVPHPTFNQEEKEVLYWLIAKVQESTLPLSLVAEETLSAIHKAIPNTKMTLDDVVDQIKGMFVRESYMSLLPGQNAVANRFEDTDACRGWRWEIVSLESLWEGAASLVKKARAARRKLRKHAKNLVSLLTTLGAAEEVFLDKKSSWQKCDAATNKISVEEEKVLRFEREEAKVRLTQEAKRRKEEERQEKLRQKQVAKEEKLKAKEKHEEEKRLAKQKKLEEKLKAKEKQEEEKRLAKQKKKEESDRLREEKKRKREEDKVKELQEEQEKLQKKKARMMSFFSSQRKTAAEDDAAIRQDEPTRELSESFWSAIDSRTNHEGPLFPRLSDRAKASRRRRTKKVSVEVYVTVVSPSDAFGVRPYAESQRIVVPNKMKFLSFYEDHRPPYYGTWNKTSKSVSGRTPIVKDTDFFDYNVDSEAEWEEGDDEIGEDLQDETADGEEENMDPEEGDTRRYNYADGWLAEDDDVVYEHEEVDDETKELRKKLKRAVSTTEQEQSDLCVVAPFTGGIPLADAASRDHTLDLTAFAEGALDAKDCLQLALVATEAEVVVGDDVCMDPFPPSLVDETFVGNPSSPPKQTPKAKATASEMSREDLKVFAKFVHLCTYNSKDRVVEELRKAHPKTISTRAQANRKLDSIAVKKRNPKGGVIWLIKDEVLDELGLHKLKKKVLENEEEPKTNPSPKAKKQAQPPKKPSASPSIPKTEPATKRKQAATPTSGQKRKQGQLGSAKLMANFFTKKPKP